MLAVQFPVDGRICILHRQRKESAHVFIMMQRNGEGKALGRIDGGVQLEQNGTVNVLAFRFHGIVRQKHALFEGIHQPLGKAVSAGVIENFCFIHEHDDRQILINWRQRAAGVGGDFHGSFRRDQFVSLIPAGKPAPGHIAR